MKSSKKPMSEEIIKDLMTDEFDSNGAFYYLEKAVEEELELIPTRSIYDPYDILDFEGKVKEFIKRYSKKLKEVTSDKHKSGIDRIKVKDIYEILRSKDVGIL